MDPLRPSDLNLHHLQLFWATAKAGGVTKAAAQLRLSQPTISAQLRSLEATLGVALFQKSGRGLALTDEGQTVLSYADAIFSLRQELLDVLSGQQPARASRLVVGVANVVPKQITWRVLAALGNEVQLLVREDHTEQLLAGLAARSLDVVLSDAPVPPTAPFRAVNHPLGRSTLSLFAHPSLLPPAPAPLSLQGLPFLLPTEDTSLRRSLDAWMAEAGLQPRIAGAFADSALLAAFGQQGRGVFALPSVIAAEICAQYGVREIGVLSGVEEHFYAVTVEQKRPHPLVARLTQAAKGGLFGAAPPADGAPGRSLLFEASRTAGAPTATGTPPPPPRDPR